MPGAVPHAASAGYASPFPAGATRGSTARSFTPSRHGTPTAREGLSTSSYSHPLPRGLLSISLRAHSRDGGEGGSAPHNAPASRSRGELRERRVPCSGALRHGVPPCTTTPPERTSWPTALSGRRHAPNRRAGARGFSTQRRPVQPCRANSYSSPRRGPSGSAHGCWGWAGSGREVVRFTRGLECGISSPPSAL